MFNASISHRPAPRSGAPGATVLHAAALDPIARSAQAGAEIAGIAEIRRSGSARDGPATTWGDGATAPLARSTGDRPTVPAMLARAQARREMRAERVHIAPETPTPSLRRPKIPDADVGARPGAGYEKTRPSERRRPGHRNIRRYSDWYFAKSRKTRAKPPEYQTALTAISAAFAPVPGGGVFSNMVRKNSAPPCVPGEVAPENEFLGGVVPKNSRRRPDRHSYDPAR